jgi:hypothetical protein
VKKLWKGNDEERNCMKRILGTENKPKTSQFMTMF